MGDRLMLARGGESFRLRLLLRSGSRSGLGWRRSGRLMRGSSRETKVSGEFKEAEV